MHLLFATSNPHKIEEVAAILDPLGITVLGLDSLGDPPDEPVEDGTLFADNARIKARYYAAAAGRICLADDSGIEVDALNGEPGVISARYAGISGTREQCTKANNAKLLGKLKDVPEDQRTARFVCSMCLADPDGNVLAESRGTFDGVITSSPRGSSGFGYDPLMLLPELGRTVAELPAEEKNARSHRGKAARRMAAKLRDIDLGS